MMEKAQRDPHLWFFPVQEETRDQCIAVKVESVKIYIPVCQNKS